MIGSLADNLMVVKELLEISYENNKSIIDTLEEIEKELRAEGR